MSCLHGRATPMPAPARQGVLLSIGFHWDNVLPVPPLHWRKETIGSSIISVPTPILISIPLTSPSPS